MNRLLVALLAALDAAIAVAVGLVVVAAPLTLLWVFGFPGAEDWAALWPTSVRLWQFGHFVPIEVTLTEEYLTATGIPDEAASFVLSLAPTALAAFTAIFAARSGGRAARAGAWPFGVVAGTIVVAAVATAIALTARIDLAAVDVLPAVLFPVLVYALPAFGGALVGAWRHGDDSVMDAARAALRRHPQWTQVPPAAARGLAAAVVGLIGFGALALAVAVFARGGAIVGLYQAAHVDLIGVIVLSLGQLAYLPTLVVWGASYVAGPGFALGAGTTVSPAGTSLGVVPGIPIFGAIPEQSSSWMLLLALGVIGVGALAGWTARTRLAVAPASHDPIAERLVVLAVIVIGSGAAAAGLAALASGSLGPGRLATTGPAPGPFALVVAVEMAIGAGILLLAPRLEPAPESASGAVWTQPSERWPAGQQWRDHADHLDTEPVAPAGVPDPAESHDPAEPMSPAGYGDTTQPIAPYDSGRPTAPMTPRDAAAPVGPLGPGDPTEPIDPLGSGYSTEPGSSDAATRTGKLEPAPFDATETIPLDEHLPPRGDAEDHPRPPVD